MLNRRFLRIKVMQALYAFFQSENERVDLAEKQLIQSIEKLYELFIYQLSLLIEIVDFTKIKVEEAKLKFLPSPDELNPNTRFIDNRLIKQIAENINFQRKREEYRINWSDESEMIRRFYLTIKESKEYLRLVNESEDTYDADKEFIIKIFKKYILPSEPLQSLCAEKSIYWVDDFDTAGVMLLKFFKTIDEESKQDFPFPVLFKDTTSGGKSEDKDFLLRLFQRTIIHNKDFEQIIADNAKNWEIERIAVMDIVLLKMAICELIDFKSIPIKVTLNEYIELAKMYSTPKSSIFINGLLDKLIGEFKSEGKIKKSGRGLME